eukprot:scaffold20754_cov37-Phaeocystis_antarctica.AAC.2
MRQFAAVAEVGKNGLTLTLTSTLTLTLTPTPNPSPTPTPNQVGKNGLGVLWNLCDSDDHWSAFLQAR